MKLTTLLMIIALVQASAKSFSQKITLHETKAPLEKVLKTIKQQSGYEFLYLEDDFKNEKITVQITNGSLEETLKACFTNSNIDYKIVGNSIVLKKNEPTFIDKIKAALAQVTIRGKVVDEQGQPIPGANVRQKDHPGNGTTTDKNGAYTLTVTDENALVIFSYTGYETVELKAKDIAVGSTITLKANITNLKEVIVNKGYYSEKAELSTGSVGTLRAAEIEKQVINNPLAGLEGRIPGLNIAPTNGVTGSQFSVQIRGQNSLLNGSEPLFVIDGVPFAPNNQKINLFYSMGTISGGSAGNGGMSPFYLVNPYDIESIEVLKDADATAIYGSRGANGVILITTKKGKSGKATMNINVFSGESRVAQMIKMLNTQDYVKLRKEAFKNDNITPNVTNAYDLMVWDTTRYTDWQKLMIGNTAHVSDANVSSTGGSENTHFVLGGAYHRETTVFPSDIFVDNRASFSGNLKHGSKDNRLQINWSTAAVIDNNTEPGAMGLGMDLPPNAPGPYDASGKLSWGPSNAPFTNPLGSLLSNVNLQSTNILSNLVFGYEIIKGLSAKASLGYNAIFTRERQLSPINATSPYSSTYGTASSIFGNNDFKSWIIEPQFNYIRKLDKLKIEALVGGSLQNNQNNYLSIQGNGYTSDALITSINSAPTKTVYSAGSSEYKYAALFGRVNFNFQDKYIVNLSGRRDGSSRFGPDKQYNNFGAVGAAWLFTNESFINNHLSFINFGKLRASYGVTGNDQIGDYKYLSTWSSSGVGAGYAGASALVPGGLFNPDYTWERNKKAEVGLDLGFLKNRLTLTAAFYRNRSDNQLVQYKLPSQTGFTTILQNFPATIENSGWEFTTSFDVWKGKNGYANIAVNLSLPKNRLVSYPGIATSSYANTYIIGKSVNLKKGYNLTGVDPTTGNFILEDIDKNGTLSFPNDYVYFGNGDPDFYGGASLIVAYKGIELSGFLDFKQQLTHNYLYSFYNNILYMPGRISNVMYLALNRWQKPGDITEVMKLTENSGTDAYKAANNVYASNGIYSMAYFVKLRNLSISYNIPKSWISALKVSSAKIYLQGQNLLTFTNLKGGLDPEMPEYISNIPQLRTLTVGVRLTF